MTPGHRVAETTDPGLSAVLDAYGLTPSGERPLPGGMENTHVLAETPHGPVVITQLRKKAPAAAEEYARFLYRLEQADIPAPRLLRRRDGGWVTSHAGHPVIVCGHVPGRHHAVLPPHLVEDVGTILGRTHRTVPAPDATLAPHLRLTSLEAALLADLPDTPFARWARATHRGVAHVTAQSGSESLVAVHADVFPDNVIVTGSTDSTDSGGVVLIDWEDCSADLPVVDVGMALIGLCCSSTGFSVRRARRLLRGYRTGSGIVLDPARVRDAALHAAVLVALRRYQWRQEGHLPADPSRSHTVLARGARDLEQRWPEVSGC
ncbi:phosphotransferase enzyme family protein [Streptomyces sp. NPDC051644]|uniref:phosphotransferase enzyme family protein n=1 Tax=Streptomyces sp. NPDC051644 TaxID=3365666 RepID=UPI00378F2C5C